MVTVCIYNDLMVHTVCQAHRKLDEDRDGTGQIQPLPHPRFVTLYLDSSTSCKSNLTSDSQKKEQ